MDVTEEHPDVLQNIEFSVLSFAKKNNFLRDEHCLSAYEFLKKKYIGDMRGWKKDNLTIKDPIVSDLVTAILPFSERRLSQGTVSESSENVLNMGTIEIETMVKCFERLALSVKRWSAGKKNSRKYLEFTSKFNFVE